MTVTSVAVAATKSLFGMRCCTVDIYVDTGDFSLVLGILHVCGQGHMRSHVFPGMDWQSWLFNSCAYSVCSIRASDKRLKLPTDHVTTMPLLPLDGHAC